MVSLRRKGEQAARSAQQGSDILGRTLPRASEETERQPRPDPSLCWTQGHSSAHEQDLDLASVSPAGRWAGRLMLEVAGHYNLVDVSLFMPLR